MLALIFTVVVQVLTLAVKVCLVTAGTFVTSFGYWTDSTQLVWSVMLATLVGLLVAYLANSDQLHALLRQLGITDQTSFSSEWYGALCQNRGYVVLHLVGQRRLYSWQEEWPSAPDAGHFVITQAEWLCDNNESTQLTGVERIIIKASDVEMVEMMAPSALQMEVENGRS